MKENPSYVTEEEAIYSSVKKGDLETLKVFITTRTSDQNPIVFEWGSGAKSTVLDIAAYYNHLKIIVWYKDVLGFSDINPKDNKGNTPLSQAIGQRQIDVVKFYIKNGYKASSKILSQSINSHLATMQPHEYSHKVISLKFLILQINLELKKKV